MSRRRPNLGLLGRSVRSPEEAGLENVPRGEDGEGGGRKATVGRTFRLTDTIPRLAAGRSDVGVGRKKRSTRWPTWLRDFVCHVEGEHETCST
ncbi:hypothetical protein T11_11842 [Trichinella zimbabwensis]|uniref:Uncharacterized protein n=1 Tax=Trichinella zimbabwensis TaxID=268475 RepID=A0A0V1GT00_9BILA|nr:hypothetical protein T11_11842 [Trichinella zimbabwensis]